MVDIIDGNKVEYYLCKSCIDKTKAYMFDIPNPDLSKYDIALKCNDCGLTWEQFVQMQRLKCPNDYAVFKDKLIPVLDSYHKSSEHIGKKPSTLPLSVDDLKKQLSDAIKKEDYETAAILRDKIKAIGGKS